MIRNVCHSLRSKFKSFAYIISEKLARAGSQLESKFVYCSLIRDEILHLKWMISTHEMEHEVRFWRNFKMVFDYHADENLLHAQIIYVIEL